MDNLITVFMDYKKKCLIEYALQVCKESAFIKKVFNNYFQTYIDNYYYNIFNTIDDDKYTVSNLKLELTGMMEEMLEDYKEFELEASNEEYSNNQKLIKECKIIAEEIIRIDQLQFENKEVIKEQIENYLETREYFKTKKVNIQKLISLIKNHYQQTEKILSYSDTNFYIEEKYFQENKNKEFIVLKEDIKSLNIYKTGMVNKVYEETKLDSKKTICLIEKVSLKILKKLLKKEKLDTYFIELKDSLIFRGLIQNKIMTLMDNPIFRKHVVLCVHYNNYLKEKNAFFEDFNLACIQDFSHINDVEFKTNSIYEEGIFNYLIVEKYKPKDFRFFKTYENEAIEILIFEEE